MDDGTDKPSHGVSRAVEAEGGLSVCYECGGAGEIQYPVCYIARDVFCEPPLYNICDICGGLGSV